MFINLANFLFGEGYKNKMIKPLYIHTDNLLTFSHKNILVQYK